MTYQQRSRTRKPKRNASSGGLDLHAIEPITKPQEQCFQAFAAGKNLLMAGPAGVGKTLVAMYLGLREVAAGRAARVVIVRSAVPSRDIGFLPGGLDEKVALYEAPYVDACSFLYGRDDAYSCLKSYRHIEFMTTSFARGTNVRDAVLYIDEAENMVYHELDTMITRTSEQTRLIVTGDENQSDLVRREEREGFGDFRRVLAEMESFVAVEFSIKDVRRSGLVRDYLETRNRVLNW